MLWLQIFSIAIVGCTSAAQMDVLCEWKYVDYVWDSANTRNKAIYEKKYNKELIFTIDVQKAPDGRIFVTTPAASPNAVPATISTVSRQTGPGGPLLRPYPNWSWHNATNCEGITSVYRVAIDDCDRLFVLDSGKVGDNQVCPTQIFIFDSWTDELISRITIPNSLLGNSSKNQTLGLLITPVVETEGPKCEKTFVYMADVVGRGLVISDGTNIRRLENKVFDPVQGATTLTIAGVSFDLSDGLFALALTPPGISPRRLFFRPLASLKEHFVPVKDLHRSLYKPDYGITYSTSDYSFPSQVAAHAISSEGILFYGLTREIAIGCWNVNTPLDDKHAVIVAQNNETLQFASGVKVTRSSRNRCEEELWVMTNRFQNIATGNQNFSEVNYRILKASVDTLVEGTSCRK